jgi:type IV secretion system protein VirD4
MLNSSPFQLSHPLHRWYNPFGSANFLTEKEAIESKLTEQGTNNTYCPYIGTFMDNVSGYYNHLFARKPCVSNPLNTTLPEGNGHLLTVAPTRAGKGTGQIIPNLLSWIGSVLVIDIKGENYLRSAGYRQQELKQKVIRFAPFED